MDQRDRHRPLADGARDPLDRARVARRRRRTPRARSSRARTAPGVSGQPWSRTSGPARMNPRSSRATTPSSQSVRGAAPMNTKQASTSSTVSVPSAARIRQRVKVTILALGRRPPAAQCPHLDVRDRRDLFDRILRHRLRPGNRREPASSTLAGVAAEVDGGLAAEFAPPITTTCWSAHARASMSAAP